MSIDQTIAKQREELIHLMLAANQGVEETPDSDVQQFIVGFVQALEESAKGDHRTRDLYLTSVIPALRAGQMGLDVVLGGMIRVSVAAGAVLGPEHARWVADYCAEYTGMLLRLWQAEP